MTELGNMFYCNCIWDKIHRWAGDIYLKVKVRKKWSFLSSWNPWNTRTSGEITEKQLYQQVEVWAHYQVRSFDGNERPTRPKSLTGRATNKIENRSSSCVSLMVECWNVWIMFAVCVNCIHISMNILKNKKLHIASYRLVPIVFNVWACVFLCLSLCVVCVWVINFETIDIDLIFGTEEYFDI